MRTRAPECSAIDYDAARAMSARQKTSGYDEVDAPAVLRRGGECQRQADAASADLRMTAVAVAPTLAAQIRPRQPLCLSVAFEPGIDGDATFAGVTEAQFA